MNPEFLDRLVRTFGPDRVGCHAPLARFTTMKVGGPADWLLEPASSAEIVAALRLAHEAAVPVTILGGGSNVIIGDKGIRGLVLRPRDGHIAQAGDRLVRADAAVTINSLVRWTMSRGLGGLEAWAGTPGTVGGAVYGNAHYGGRLIGDLIVHVVLVTRDGVVREVPVADLQMGYDTSRLQATGEVLLAAVFGLQPGADVSALRATARQSLAHRKRTQPLDVPTAGCMFQNPSAGEMVPDGVPRSAGALIDRAGLKGRSVGGAMVSPVHANFIVNTGRATAAEIRALITECRDTVADRFGVHLKDEIVWLGEF
jgi:UDP-N-acetylmuramate dehydrogenase